MFDLRMCRAAGRLASLSFVLGFAACDSTHDSPGGAEPDAAPGAGGSRSTGGGSHTPPGSAGDASASRGGSSNGGNPSTLRDAAATSPGTHDGGKRPVTPADSGTSKPRGTPDAGSDGAPPDAAPPGALATELVPGDVTIVGLTNDGWAVFRQGDALRAAQLSAPFAIQDVAAKAGSVVIRGKVVFNWADMNWTTNMGDLSIWTASAGAHEIGATQYAEGLVAASDAGDVVAYTTNLKPTTMDVVLAPSDLSASQVVLKSVGRGSNTTCTATLGFVGARFFTGYCVAAARAGSIARFDHGANGWQSTVLSTGALPAWSADATGDKVFFESASYAGQYVEGGQTHTVDSGVGSGVLLPDGSAILYNVGDQLRRTSLPSINPITVVTTGYSQPVAFSPSFHYALYSTKVTYVMGTQRDLRITTTEAFNPAPTVLVAQPLATLPRSFMTNDEKLVLYLTDVTATGANLHAVSVNGTERTVLPGVVEAAATHGGTIVFTDGSSDPNRYPVVADLKMADLDAGGAPRLLETKVIDGKSFQIDASGTRVVYVQAAIDGDGGETRPAGLFVRTLQ